MVQPGSQKHLFHLGADSLNQWVADEDHLMRSSPIEMIQNITFNRCTCTVMLLGYPFKLAADYPIYYISFPIENRWGILGVIF